MAPPGSSARYRSSRHFSFRFRVDLKPLYDNLQDCRADTIQLDIARKNLIDEQARITALTHERDAAIAATHGGAFWIRLRRGAKWFAIGVGAGAAATALARR